jgi:hypothetical protein
LKRGEWEILSNHYKLLHIDYLALDAFLAFSQKSIELEEFCTVLFFYYANIDFPESHIRIFRMYEEDGFENDEAVEIIQSTFSDDIDIEHFLSRMDEKTLSEKVFFFVPYREKKIAKLNEDDVMRRIRDVFSGDITITDEINRVSGNNYFHLFEFEGEKFQMIPSFSMMQEFLKIAYKENAVRIRPTFGISKLIDIRMNGLESSRDMGFYFPSIDLNGIYIPEVTLPDRADGFVAPTKIDFIKHDFYHSIRSSEVEPFLRSAFISVADQVQSMKLTEINLTVQRYLSFFYERLIDMEHHFFVPEYLRTLKHLISPTTAFYLSIEDAALRAIDRMIIESFVGHHISKEHLTIKLIDLLVLIKKYAVFEKLKRKLITLDFFKTIAVFQDEIFLEASSYYKSVHKSSKDDGIIHLVQCLEIDGEVKTFMAWRDYILEGDKKFIALEDLFSLVSK